VGWGFQLQSPIMVIGLIILFTGLTLNMLDIFTVGSNLTQLTPQAASQESTKNTFMAGLLTAIVATPCSAPFMGSAIGATLTKSPGVTILILSMLGAGLAAPMMVLIAYPKLTRWIPKPGPWMKTLKQILGSFLALTVCWLVWVLNGQTTSFITNATLAGIIGLVMSLWWIGKTQRQESLWPLDKSLMAFVTLIGLMALLLWAPQPKSNAPSNWHPYSTTLIQELEAHQKPYFINFTARWCLSCQVNKATLNSPAIQTHFKDQNITLIIADWTQKDDRITAALEQYGRNSIPTYIYNDGKKGPIILSEILTPGYLKGIIQK